MNEEIFKTNSKDYNFSVLFLHNNFYLFFTERSGKKRSARIPLSEFCGVSKNDICKISFVEVDNEYENNFVFNFYFCRKKVKIAFSRTFISNFFDSFENFFVGVR